MKTIKVFLEEVRKSYENQFPKSHITAQFSSGYGGSIYIKAYLAEDKNECINNYWENDMFNIRFTISSKERLFTVDSRLPNQLVLVGDSTTFTIEAQGHRLAYSSKKVNFKKICGDGEEIIKSLDKFFSQLRVEFDNALKSGLIDKNHYDLAKNK